MNRQIEKLALTPREYSVFGTLMMVLCILFGVAAFCLADYSFAFSGALAAVAVESGFVGYCFRCVSVKLKNCDDPGILAQHKATEKSARNSVCISMFMILTIVVCVAGALIFVNFKPLNNAVAHNSMSVQTQETTQASQTQESVIPQIVYSTPSGSKYHYSSNCAGKRSFAITMQEALNHSLTPCQKCTDT